MTKFNIPAPPPTPDATTAQGGSGFARDAKQELFLLGLANAVGTDDAYEAADVRDKRFADLVHEVTNTDPEWTAQYARWLRNEGNMRSASIVLAAEFVRARHLAGAAKPGRTELRTTAREVVASVLQRADEPTEILAYWTSRYGRPIPAPIKRGVADALRRMGTERNTLRYDGQGKPWRMGDAIDLTHPKPSAEWQADLFRFALDRRHNRENPRTSERLATIGWDRYLMAVPTEQRRAHLEHAVSNGWSWERLAGWLPGGMDAAAWEAVIPNMGLMALARNLRNFDEAGVSDAVAMRVQAKFTDPAEVRASRQFPLRFLTAWKAVKSVRWGTALEAALNLSTENIPHLDGRTLILIDVSGSMMHDAVARRAQGPRHEAPTEKPQRWEVAAIFGMALAKRGEADVFVFNTGVDVFDFDRRGGSILRGVEALRSKVGGGTDTLGAIAATYTAHDRVVIVTDEQTGVGGRTPHWPQYLSAYGYGALGDPDVWNELQRRITVPVVTWNLGGFETGHSPQYRNWVTVGGLSDAAFTLLPTIEARIRGQWPWDVRKDEA